MTEWMGTWSRHLSRPTASVSPEPLNDTRHSHPTELALAWHTLGHWSALTVAPSITPREYWHKAHWHTPGSYHLGSRYLPRVPLVHSAPRPAGSCLLTQQRCPMHGVPWEAQLVPTLILGLHHVTPCTEKSRSSQLDLQLQQSCQDALAAESTRIHKLTPALTSAI